MLELVVLSDSDKGRRFQSNAAPVRLGRRADLEVRLPFPGVWELHAEIQTDSAGWYVIRPLGQSLVTVNQQPVQDHRLRNGDVLSIGAVKLQFGLRSSPQQPLRYWEVAVWATIYSVFGIAVIVLIAMGR